MRYRAVVNGVSFYINTRQINDGVGDYSPVNLAVQMALATLKKNKEYSGIASTFNGMNVQLDIVK
jgi:hypothetical protein